MQDIVHLLAVSNRGKSRIGKNLVTAIVEQSHHDKIFVVIPNSSEKKNAAIEARDGAFQCRWIKRVNDPDFRIIEEED